MGHLTSSVIKSTLALFDAAGVAYTFIDKNGSVCYGRPLQMNGHVDAAKQLIDKNNRLIVESEAEVLVTSCPICAREFVANYHLPIPVLHHSQFLLELTQQNRLIFRQSELKVTYHDPFELSRGLNKTREPRELLQHAVILSNSNKETESKSLCYGGSLGITNISMVGRNKIATDTLSEIVAESSNYLATAYPMCCKTFANAEEKIKVFDIAEILEKNLNFAPENESEKKHLQIKHHTVISKIIKQCITRN